MRNLGGGIGISAVTTLLSRGSQGHQAVLVGHLTPYEPVFRERFHTLEGALGSRGAYAAIYGTLVQQATLLAFVDIFRYLTLVCLLCVPLVFLLKRVRGGGGGPPAH
jgi:DHA2 family multidrug resistance protein